MTEFNKACGGESSGAAAAVKDVSVNLPNDTLIKAMLIFHCEGEEACVGLFPQYGRGSIINKLVETCKQLKPGLFDLDITMAELREELLKVNKLELSKTQMVDVTPLAGLVNLTQLHLERNPIVDTSPLRSLPKSTKITGVSVCCRSCTIV